MDNCLFGSVKLTKHADLDKYEYTGYGIGFDSPSEFLFTEGSYGSKIEVEAKYPINFTESGKRFVLSLHYNRSNSFLFVNATKLYQFKAKNSEKKIIHCA